MNIGKILNKYIEPKRIGTEKYMVLNTNIKTLQEEIEKELSICDVVSSKSKGKHKLNVNVKEKLEQLLEEIRPHCQYWDCRNDVPLDENHAAEVALICIDKQLELLRYLGSFQIEDLQQNLIKQKQLLK